MRKGIVLPRIRPTNGSNACYGDDAIHGSTVPPSWGNALDYRGYERLNWLRRRAAPSAHFCPHIIGLFTPIAVGMNMPLFFLHVRDGDRLIRDSEGSVLDDLEAARSEAIESARELMVTGIVDEGRIGIERSIVVCDASGTTLLMLPFCEAITLT